MRTIERPASFKRDYKREAKGQHRTTLDELLIPVIKALVADLPLEPRLCDHSLVDCLDDIATNVLRILIATNTLTSRW